MKIHRATATDLRVLDCRPGVLDCQVLHMGVQGIWEVVFLSNLQISLIGMSLIIIIIIIIVLSSIISTIIIHITPTTYCPQILPLKSQTR